MNAGGGEREDPVARRNVLLRQQLLALDRAEREAREVVIARGVKPRHLGGLAADERAARLLAARRDPLDHFGRLFGIELAAGEIIEKQQGLRALHHEVVHVHGDQIDADRVVAAALDRELQLGADPVGRGHEQGIAIARALQVEHPAEAADLGIGAGARGRFHQRLDQIDEPVAGIDIDAGVAVAEPSRLGHFGLQGGPVSPNGAATQEERQNWAALGREPAAWLCLE